ncbi:MAG: S9 family peptidase, partial [Methanothrix sp.]
MLLISMLILVARDGPYSPGPNGENGSLIPRQVLFGNPDKTSVKISPDGSQISYLAPANGVLNLWVAPAEDPLRARPVTNDTHRGIRSYAWAYNNEILYLQDTDGDENWRLFKVNPGPGKGEVECLTPKGCLAAIQKISLYFPNEILVCINDRDPRYHDIYRFNLSTGNRSLLQKNPGFGGFITDDQFQVRLAVNLTADGGAEYLVPRNGSWEIILKINSEDYSPYLSSPIGIDKTGRMLFFTDNRNRDTAALKVLDLDSGRETLIAEDPNADASAVLVHPRDCTIQAVAFTYDRKHWKILDSSIEKDMARLREVADGEMDVVSRSLDDKAWIVSYLRDNGPGDYYYYNRSSGEARFLFTWNKELEDKPLARMHPVIIKSRDGLDLISYITLPLGRDGDGNDHPDRPLPLVLLVHGGPWYRDNWGYNSIHQWLANR